MKAEKNVADVGPWLDTMTFCTCHDRIEYGRSWPRRLTAQEEPILTANGLVAKRPLTDVVVDRQTTVFGVATESRPLVMCIGHGFAQGARLPTGGFGLHFVSSHGCCS